MTRSANIRPHREPLSAAAIQTEASSGAGLLRRLRLLAMTKVTDAPSFVIPDLVRDTAYLLAGIAPSRLLRAYSSGSWDRPPCRSLPGVTLNLFQGPWRKIESSV